MSDRNAYAVAPEMRRPMATGVAPDGTEFARNSESLERICAAGIVVVPSVHCLLAPTVVEAMTRAMQGHCKTMRFALMAS